MRSRLGLMLPLVAALAMPGGALASHPDVAGPAPEALVQLAQGKSDDAKGKAKGKAKAKAKAKGKAEAKAKGADKKAEKQAEKDAKKAEKEAEKIAKKDDKDKKDEAASGKPGHARGADTDDARRREMEKHERRMAKIARFDELAANGKRAKLKEKADHLRQLENKRHARALARIDRQGEKAADADEPADAPASKEEPAARDAPEEKKAAVGGDKAPVESGADKPTERTRRRTPERASTTDKGGER